MRRFCTAGASSADSDDYVVPDDDAYTIAAGNTTVQIQIQVRPSAAVALRWVSKVMIQGWWGDSGSVTLAGRSFRGLSGNGTAWLVSGLGSDSVTALEFSFRGVRVRNDTECDAPVLPVAIPLDTAVTLPDPGVD